LPAIIIKGIDPDAADQEVEIKRLHEKSGRLSVENGFRGRAFRR